MPPEQPVNIKNPSFINSATQFINYNVKIYVQGISKTTGEESAEASTHQEQEITPQKEMRLNISKYSEIIESAHAIVLDIYQLMQHNDLLTERETLLNATYVIDKGHTYQWRYIFFLRKYFSDSKYHRPTIMRYYEELLENSQELKETIAEFEIFIDHIKEKKSAIEDKIKESAEKKIKLSYETTFPIIAYNSAEFLQMHRQEFEILKEILDSTVGQDYQRLKSMLEQYDHTLPQTKTMHGLYVQVIDTLYIVIQNIIRIYDLHPLATVSQKETCTDVQFYTTQILYLYSPLDNYEVLTYNMSALIKKIKEYKENKNLEKLHKAYVKVILIEFQKVIPLMQVADKLLYENNKDFVKEYYYLPYNQSIYEMGKLKQECLKCITRESEEYDTLASLVFPEISTEGKIEIKDPEDIPSESLDTSRNYAWGAQIDVPPLDESITTSLHDQQPDTEIFVEGGVIETTSETIDNTNFAKYSQSQYKDYKYKSPQTPTQEEENSPPTAAPPTAVRPTDISYFTLDNLPNYAVKTEKHSPSLSPTQ